MRRGRQFGQMSLLWAAVGLLTFAASGPASHSSPKHAGNLIWDERSARLGLLSDASPSGDRAQLASLIQDDALAANKLLLFSSEPVEAAPPFSQPGKWQQAATYDSAVECLTAAIYYEAAGEGETGQRAVAQVVLNRVRHPAFPASICGVVYQGAELRTGCQFTFTCDGSLMRKPSLRGWANARRVAVQALQGKVEPAIGMATHYHANYVLPYWAPRLDKVAAIDTHIFYRWSGSWGKRRAFSQSYIGEASGSPYIEAARVLEDGVGAQVLNAAVTSPADELPQLRPKADPPTVVRRPSRLRADEKRGTLKVDSAPPQLLTGSERTVAVASLN